MKLKMRLRRNYNTRRVVMAWQLIITELSWHDDSVMIGYRGIVMA
jgi:hypothetical protein